MRVLVTGSAGHLGEGLVRTLRNRRIDVVSVDRKASPFTSHVGSIVDAPFVRRCMRGVDVVLHAATLHKPHVATHSRTDFVDTNITGTLNVLEAALSEKVSGVVFTSTTSVFGAALNPVESEPAAWIDEGVVPVPKNIYGVTKRAAEDLCELFYRTRGLPCIVLRTSRFFPEVDDSEALREGYDDLNLKANEFLYRRLDLSDAVEAHCVAARRIPEVGFGTYVASATTPFSRDDASALRSDAPSVVRRLFPDYESIYAARGWKMLPGIDRVYDNRRACEELGWRPEFDFRTILDRVEGGDPPFSALARAVGSKGYHPHCYEDGPYPVGEPIEDPLAERA